MALSVLSLTHTHYPSLVCNEFYVYLLFCPPGSILKVGKEVFSIYYYCRAMIIFLYYYLYLFLF